MQMIFLMKGIIFNLFSSSFLLKQKEIEKFLWIEISFFFVCFVFFSSRFGFNIIVGNKNCFNFCIIYFWRKKNSIKKSNSYGTSSTLINTLLSHNIHLTSSKLLVNDADSFITHKRESSLVNR